MSARATLDAAPARADRAWPGVSLIGAFEERAKRARAWAAGAVVIVVVGMAVAVVLTDRLVSPVVAAARTVAAERWYAVMFRHKPIGHYHARGGRDADGRFEFRTVLRFQLSERGETRMEDRLVFHQRAPHPLVRAEHVATTADGERSVRIAGGRAQVREAGAEWSAPVRDDLTMADYLAVETWLAAGAVTGAGRRSRALDFDQLKVVSVFWRVARVDDDGVEIVKDSDARTRIALDADLLPRRMRIGGPFVLRRVPDERTARLWERDEPLFATAIPRGRVVGTIANPGAVRRLVLAVEGGNGADLSWLGEALVGAPPEARETAVLVTSWAGARRAADAGELADALASTVSYPAAAPDFRALAGEAARGAVGDAGKARAIALFVHRFLRYEDSAVARNVFEVVLERKGDCTEFADLFTTIARAAGLPARTVVGLAYRPDSQSERAGEFGLHAWNEVAVDGEWRGVDPTWGQTTLDATHLALAPEGVLGVAAALPELTFRVVEAGY